MKPSDKIDVEYCYSGFMGYPLVIFIWSGDKLIQTIYKNEKGELVSRPGMRVKVDGNLTKAEKFFNWLRKTLITVIEGL